MRSTDFIASVKATINASIDKVWNALIDPETIKKYMFGTTVTSDFKEGSKITWKGEWEGKQYEDKGAILQIEPKRKLQYSHFSPLSGSADLPENYHIVSISLIGNEKQTVVTLTQDNNETEKARDHSEKNWRMMLNEMKKLLEKNSSL